MVAFWWEGFVEQASFKSGMEVMDGVMVVSVTADERGSQSI